jgi:hypothetical protein
VARRWRSDEDVDGSQSRRDPPPTANQEDNMSTRISVSMPLCRLIALGACLGALCHPAFAGAGADDALHAAAEDAAAGQVSAAVQTLNGLAEAGNVAAMERLALMHLYGPALYPTERWQHTVAMHWLEQAAGRDSDLARFLLARDAGKQRVSAR